MIPNLDESSILYDALGFHCFSLGVHGWRFPPWPFVWSYQPYHIGSTTTVADCLPHSRGWGKKILHCSLKIVFSHMLSQQISWKLWWGLEEFHPKEETTWIDLFLGELELAPFFCLKSWWCIDFFLMIYVSPHSLTWPARAWPFFIRSVWCIAIWCSEYFS